MSSEQMDPSLIQDFLTEANELVEQLDSDLVSLEESGESGESRELLDGIFRALHTIKGAASFLSMTPLTTFAHTAEDALNRMRKGEIAVTTEVMDSLLRSVDVLRGMLGEVAGSTDISEAPDDLMGALKALCEQDGAAGEQAAGGDAPGDAAEATGSGGDAGVLSLPPEKADLMPFMIEDLREAIAQIGQHLEHVKEQDHRPQDAEAVRVTAEGVFKTAEFFDLAGLKVAARALVDTAAAVTDLADDQLEEVTVRWAALLSLIDQQTEALGDNRILDWPLETLVERLSSASRGEALDSSVAGKHKNDPAVVLELDGVVTPTAGGPQPTEETAAVSAGQAVGATPVGAETAAAQAKGGAGPERAATVVEQTIRVEVSRLEALLNLVGQLVLNKNRLMAQSRKMREHTLPQEVEEDFLSAAGDLDRLTGELQVGVMRTRMQPLAKLFDRYPRVIRDVARSTGKSIQLEIIGKETEVDKSVIELLADPLVHILRNSADHGIEMPEVRAAAGKKEAGRIWLTAEHQGSHVRVTIKDNGKGLDREVIGAVAVKRGLVSQDHLASLSDEDVFRFIFAAGFSTAEKVTDLSGRGVGMDVVRTNVAKLNGAVNVRSKKGKGTTIEVLIPLTVAIMPAMIVGIGAHLYAIPLGSIVEIVRPTGKELQSVMSSQVMTLRESVLPLLDMRRVLGEAESQTGLLFAVVVGVGQQRVGLIVDHLVGQEEVVIKPLDDEYTSGGPFSGATIREDGAVSLILDTIQLIQKAQAPEHAAA